MDHDESQRELRKCALKPEVRNVEVMDITASQMVGISDSFSAIIAEVVVLVESNCSTATTGDLSSQTRGGVITSLTIRE